MQKKPVLDDSNIKKLFIKLSLPATIGMVVMSLYNITDAIFIGQGVGTDGLAGVAISFPIQMIVGAIGQMLGIGGSSLISRSLGAKDKETANKTIGNVIFTVSALAIPISIFGYIYIDPLLILFGATPGILPFAREYLIIIMSGIFFHSLAMALNNLIRAEGQAKVAMFTMVISAVLNVILDAILIFGYDMGLTGAAIATVIAYFSGVLFQGLFYLFGKSEIKVKFFNIKFEWAIQKEIISIGISAFVRQSAMSLLVIILNNSLARYGGDLYIAIYGVVMRLIMLFFTPLIGFGQGLQPILGYNYGAKRFDKAKESVRIALIAATATSTIGAAIMILFPETLLSIFSDDPNLVIHGKRALRMIVLAFPLIGFQIMGSIIFQAIGKAVQTFIITLSRQFLILIPLVYILPSYLGLDGIFLAFPSADILSVLLTFFMLLPLYRQFAGKTGHEPEEVYET